MKIVRISKAVLYIAIATLIFILNSRIMPYVGYLVGGVITLYALEELFVILIEKDRSYGRAFLYDVVAQLLISALLFISANDISAVCIVWGVWSILRESREMTRAIAKLKVYRLGIISIAESVAVIFLSFLMVVHPDENHAFFHTILLGIELVLVVVFYYLEVLMVKKTKREESDIGQVL